RRKARNTATAIRNPSRRARLQVEQLEGRCLLDAGGTTLVTTALAPPLAHIAVVPNDPSFGTQYGLNNTGQSHGKVDADIDAPEAWNVTTGSLKTIVGIVDTGVDYRHVDLYRNIWINQGEIPRDIRSRLIDVDHDGMITFWDLNDRRKQGPGKTPAREGDGRITAADILKSRNLGGWADGKDNDGNGYKDDLVGWNFVNNTNKPFDDNGHGTHVAGIIGAQGNNGVGVSGVNWKIQMIPLKFLGTDGTGSVAGAIKAIDYAAHFEAIPTNHSWSMGNVYYQPLYDAVARARARGHIVVAAAGNGGSDRVGDNNDKTPNYPASFGLDNVIAVAASTREDRLTSFSNYGRVSVD